MREPYKIGDKVRLVEQFGTRPAGTVMIIDSEWVGYGGVFLTPVGGDTKIPAYYYRFEPYIVEVKTDEELAEQFRSARALLDEARDELDARGYKLLHNGKLCVKPVPVSEIKIIKTEVKEL